jgi:streptogramin lyase
VFVRAVTLGLLFLLSFPLAAAHTVIDYALPKTTPGAPSAPIAGPDGGVWFIDSNTSSICRMDPATGQITDYPNLGATRLAVGADGAIWFANGSLIGRLDPYTGEIDQALISLAGQYSVGGMVSGPDGNLWITGGCRDAIVRASLSGVVHTFPTTSDSCPDAITNGPDGNLWFVERWGNRVGRMTTSGGLVEFPLGNVSPAYVTPEDITSGPDGNVWISTDHGTLLRMAPSGHEVSVFPLDGATLAQVTAGSDGNLWVAGLGGSPKIQRVNTSGQSTATIPLSAGTGQDRFRGITLGPDGNVWAAVNSQSIMARVTPSGQLTEFATLTRGGDPREMVLGGDGKIWFTERDANKLGSITPGGEIVEYTLPTPNSKPLGITTGTDGAVWLVENAGDRVARVAPNGAITEFPLVAGSGATDLVQGPDGNFWITATARDRIVQMTPAGATTEYPLPAGSGPGRIIVGADGKLWFTLAAQSLGRMGTGGDFTSFGLPPFIGPARPARDLAAAADGSIWFTDGSDLGRRNTDGTIFRQSVSGAERVILGADGAVWISSWNGVARYTPGTGVQYLNLPLPGSGPVGLAFGADTNLWVAQSTASRIGKVLMAFDGQPIDSCFGGQTFSGKVAKFLDFSGTGVPAHYATTISWGDGSPATAGTVTIEGEWIYVSGTHTYASTATRQVTVTITDLRESEDTATVTSTLKPQLETTIDITSTCRSEMITATVTDAGPGATYQWIIPNALDVNANGNSVTFRVEVPSTYIEVRIQKDGYCESSGVRFLGLANCNDLHDGDINGDGHGDVLWRHDNGSNAMWLMDGFTKTQGNYLASQPTSWSVAVEGDFNGDGLADIFWHNPLNGLTRVWYLQNGEILDDRQMETSPTSWSVAGAGDFNRDGRTDIFWRNTSGANAIWFMSPGGVKHGSYVEGAPQVWSVAGIGDLNGDTNADIFWRRNDTGENAIWLMNGFTKLDSSYTEPAPTNWKVAAIADLDRDGRADVIWRDPASGANAVWRMEGLRKLAGSWIEGAPPNWTLASARDFNGDGRADFFWRDSASGYNAIWMMNGFTKTAGSYVESAGPGWNVIP